MSRGVAVVLYAGNRRLAAVRGELMCARSFAEFAQDDQDKTEVRIAVISLLVVLAVLIVGNFVYYALRRAEQAERGALNTVICKACGHREVRRIQDIRDYRCSSCKGNLAYAWRCLDCKELFPFTRPAGDALPDDASREGLSGKFVGLPDWDEMHKCPHCGSLDTVPVPTAAGHED